MIPVKSLFLCLLFQFFFSLHGTATIERFPFFSTAISGELPPVGDSVKLNGHYVVSYFKDTWTIVKSPLYWKGKQWLTTGLVLGSTGVAYIFDQRINSFITSHQKPWADITFHIAEPIGNWYTIPVMGLAYLDGHCFHNYPLEKTALLSLKSYAISALFINSMKLSFHRHRPNTGDPWNTFDGPGLYFKNLSFPSGHSASAFAIMTSIALEFRETKWIQVAAYSLAAITAFSRIYENYHWTSDVIMGSAIGFFTARAVYKIQNGQFSLHKRVDKQKTTNIALPVL